MKRPTADVTRKALLTDGVVEETAEGAWMRCTCAKSPEVCTLHNESALAEWRMAVAVRHAIAAGTLAKPSRRLQ